MVKENTLKRKDGFFIVVAVLSLLMLPICVAQEVFATASCNTVNGTTTCTDSTTFNVKVTEVLTVSITKPQAWASGVSGSFLTNKVGVSVISNNPSGFTATMTTSTAATQGDSGTSLVNAADNTQTIPTISDVNGINLANSSSSLWGYGIVNTGATAPTTYYGMVSRGSASPIQIMQASAASTTMSKDVYFGAKSVGDVASGTYERGVLISVVTSVIDPTDNPVNPVNPVTPSDDEPDDDTPTYITPTTPDPKGNSSTGVTVATTHPTTNTTNTEITEGNTVSGYVAPAGVTNRTGEGTPLATGLAVTAGAAAAAGIVLFFIAKRRKDDDENDEDF